MIAAVRAAFGRKTTVQELHPHEPRTWLGRHVFSTDHKVIGIQFFALGLVMLLMGGLMALLMRFQLAWPFA